jgi:hypothetical protein
VELEPSGNFIPQPKDRRPHIPEPPPVRLTAIEDMRVPALAGVEKQLDEFYVTLLNFTREKESDQNPIYRAENVRLIFQVRESPTDRTDMRPIPVEVPSLTLIEGKIFERELPYQRMRGLLAGQEAIVLQDPAGNWVSITESRGVR